MHLEPIYQTRLLMDPLLDLMIMKNLRDNLFFKVVNFFISKIFNLSIEIAYLNTPLNLLWTTRGSCLPYMFLIANDFIAIICLIYSYCCILKISEFCANRVTEKFIIFSTLICEMSRLLCPFLQLLFNIYYS